MAPPRFTPGRGDSKPNPGGRVDAAQPHERRAKGIPPNTRSRTASVSLGRMNRKRPSEDAGDDNTNKRREVSATTPSPAPVVSDRVEFVTIQRPTIIDLTGDGAPHTNSSGSERHVKSPSNNPFLSTPLRQAQKARRYSRPLFPTTPTPSTEREDEVIDLTLDDDSDGDSTAPSSTPLKKAVQSRASGYFLYEPPVEDMVLPEHLFNPSYQRLESKHGRADPANSTKGKGSPVSTRAQTRRKSQFGTALRSGERTNGSSEASEDMPAPMKLSPAQEDTEQVSLPNKSMLAVRVRRGGFEGGHRAVDTDSVGEGGGIAELGHNDLGVSVGASQPLKPSVLTIRGQTEKQSKLIAAGRAGSSDEHDERDSTSPSSEIGRKADTRDELQPRTPRSARKRRSRVVVLRARPAELHRISQRPVQRPDIPMLHRPCFLIKIPTELQVRIFEYLLLADDPIQVLHGWASLYQRQRSNLHPAILSTCHAIYKNASAFLYGRNVFRYMVRDRAQSDASPSFREDIEVEKCIPLFRKLELKIERSRTEHAYCTSLAKAIHLLNENSADLHTLVLDVSPLVEGDTLSTVGYFYREGEIIQALKALRTKFIILRVFTPKTEKEPATSLCRKLDMRTKLGPFEGAPDQPPEAKLDELSEKITAACESPANVIKQGWFEKFEVVPQQNERRARTAMITYNDDDDDAGDSDENDDSDDDDSFWV